VLLGAQNCHYEESGAFTGEISLPMLSYLGCTYVILGHSERRTYFHEDDELINRKILAALDYGINPVVCIGETLEERQSNKTFEVLERQITLGLKSITEENINEMVVAYEPVWAIGTGVNATPEQVEEAHGFIKETIKRTLGMKTGSLPVLYGGSVNAENAGSILELENVNGALIGGASLKSESFISILKTSEEILGRA
jgi:triosephosphate isomerase